ncbi:unnamed protein product [Lota lota]
MGTGPVFLARARLPCPPPPPHRSAHGNVRAGGRTDGQTHLSYEITRNQGTDSGGHLFGVPWRRIEE